MTPWIEDKARVRCEDLEGQAVQLQQQGQPVQARATLVTAGVLRALFEEGVV